MFGGVLYVLVLFGFQLVVEGVVEYLWWQVGGVMGEVCVVVLGWGFVVQVQQFVGIEGVGGGGEECVYGCIVVISFIFIVVLCGSLVMLMVVWVWLLCVLSILLKYLLVVLIIVGCWMKFVVLVMQLVILSSCLICCRLFSVFFSVCRQCVVQSWVVWWVCFRLSLLLILLVQCSLLCWCGNWLLMQVMLVWSIIGWQVLLVMMVGVGDVCMVLFLWWICLVMMFGWVDGWKSVILLLWVVFFGLFCGS